jgi:hypothetical protein
MIDYHSTLVAALNTVLPTHYELKLHSGLSTPCISYQERNNADAAIGDTLGYSNLAYTIKVWGKDIGELQRYSLEIDKKLKALGWKRTSSNELHDTQSTMIQKILTYEALALENYN